MSPNDFLPKQSDQAFKYESVLTVTAGTSALYQLMALLEDRKRQMPEKSYTTRLFTGGVSKISEKVIEEAAEVVEAASEPGEEGRQHLIREAGDLTYHLLVMLTHCGVSLAELEAELARRFGVSGLDEKAARPAKQQDQA